MSVTGSPEDPCVWLRAVCTRKLGVTEGSLLSPPLPQHWPSIPYHPSLGAQRAGVLSQGHPRAHFLRSPGMSVLFREPLSLSHKRSVLPCGLTELACLKAPRISSLGRVAFCHPCCGLSGE